MWPGTGTAHRSCASQTGRATRRNRSTCWTLNVATAPVRSRRAVKGFAPAEGPPLSPDGRCLAYAGNDRAPQDQDVLVRDVMTGETRRVYAGGGRAYAGFWTPDGRRLTVVERRTTNSDHVVHVVS